MRLPRVAQYQQALVPKRPDLSRSFAMSVVVDYLVLPTLSILLVRARRSLQSEVDQVDWNFHVSRASVSPSSSRRTLRLSGSPTQFNKEARSRRVRSKRVLDGALNNDGAGFRRSRCVAAMWRIFRTT